MIARFNLKTPGREDEGSAADANNVLVDQPEDEPALATAGAAPDVPTDPGTGRPTA